MEGLPAAVIWDMAETNPEDWQLMRRLHNHPQLHQIPFVYCTNRRRRRKRRPG
jgi:hypothetical protein